MFIRIAILLLSLLIQPSFAGSFGTAASAPDTNQLSYPTPPGNPYCCGTNTAGKTLSSQTLNNGIRNAVLVVAGQSNASNNEGTAYTPANPTKIDNLNIYDGAIYVASDPLLGTANDNSSLGPGNVATRIADTLITNNKFDRVIIVSIAFSATAVADWATGLEYDRFRVAVSRMAAKGLTPTAVIWMQGENDNQLGTTSSAYQASLTTVINNARAAGMSSAVPWFIAKESYINGTTSAQVVSGQTSIVNSGNAVYAGPNLDAFTSASRQADNTHFNATGSAQAASAWITSLAAYGAPF